MRQSATFFDGHNGRQINDAPEPFLSNVTMMAWIKPTERFLPQHHRAQHESEPTGNFLRISRRSRADHFRLWGQQLLQKSVPAVGCVCDRIVLSPLPRRAISNNWVFSQVWDGTNWNLFPSRRLVKSEFANNGAYDVTNRWVIGSAQRPAARTKTILRRLD